MRLIKLGSVVLILFSFSNLTRGEDGDVFKEKVDTVLEQKINQNVQKIKETANISRKQETKLFKAIKETNWDIRKEQESFDNIIREVGKGIIPFCEKCVKDPNVNVRRNALSALGTRLVLKQIDYREHGRLDSEENNIEDDTIISIAMRALKDKDPEVRKSAVYTLWNSLKGFKYNPSSIEALKKVKQEDEDVNVRETAIKALRQLGIKDAFTKEEWEDLEQHGVIID